MPSHSFYTVELVNFSVDQQPSRRTPAPTPLVLGATGLVASNDQRGRLGSLGGGVKRPHVEPQKSTKPAGPSNLKKESCYRNFCY